jgi:hypothetical protein
MNTTPSLPHADVRECVDRLAAEAETSAQFPRVYVSRVRAEGEALGLPEAGSDDLHAALATMERSSLVTAEAPTASSRKVVTTAKKTIQRGVFFTTHHLATQVSSLGWAVVWFGNAVADRIEALERQVANDGEALRREVAELRERLDRIERER